MSRPKKDTLTGVQLDQLIGIAETFERCFLVAADFMGLFRRSLMEAKSARVAMKRGKWPLDYTQVLDRIDDEYIKGILERAELVKFELGRMWIQAADDLDLGGLKIARSVLESHLKGIYGVETTVRVLPPKY